MATPRTEKLISTLETDAAHVLSTAGTAFGVSLAELGTNYTKAGIVAAAVAAVHTTLVKFFPSGTSSSTSSK
jgi:hypothetical protein